MTKEEKKELLRATIAGDRKTVESILKASEAPIFVEIQPGKYCTNEMQCDCKAPKDCIYLKDEAELRSLYPKANFIGVPEITQDVIERCKEFDMPAPERQNSIELRNNLLILKSKIENE